MPPSDNTLAVERLPRAGKRGEEAAACVEKGSLFGTPCFKHVVFLENTT